MAKQQVGRLALRHEGNWWNAYYAYNDTMEGSILLGSIGMSVIQANEAHKIKFMELMKDVVTDIIEETVGVRPSWTESTKAPEHERSGHS